MLLRTSGFGSSAKCICHEARNSKRARSEWRAALWRVHTRCPAHLGLDDRHELAEYWYHRVGGELDPASALGRVGSEAGQIIGRHGGYRGLILYHVARDPEQRGDQQGDCCIQAIGSFSSSNLSLLAYSLTTCTLY